MNDVFNDRARHILTEGKRETAGLLSLDEDDNPLAIGWEMQREERLTPA